jgi:hypothetical protein
MRYIIVLILCIFYGCSSHSVNPYPEQYFSIDKWSVSIKNNPPLVLLKKDSFFKEYNKTRVFYNLYKLKGIDSSKISIKLISNNNLDIDNILKYRRWEIQNINMISDSSKIKDTVYFIKDVKYYAIKYPIYYTMLAHETFIKSKKGGFIIYTVCLKNLVPDIHRRIIENITLK